MQKVKGTLYKTIGIVIVSIIIIIMSINLAYTYMSTKVKLNDSAYYESKISIQQLTNSVSTYIESYSTNEYEKLVLNEMGHKNTLSIIVNDFNMAKIFGQDSYIIGKIRDDNWNVISYDPKNIDHKKRIQNAFFVQNDDILNSKGVRVGTISIYSSDILIKKELENIIVLNLFIIITIAMILMASLFLTIHYILLRPLSNIVDTLKDHDAEGIPKKSIKIEGTNEIRTLATTVNRMIDEIKESRVTLKQSEGKLKDSEFRWQFAVEGNGDGLWDWDLITDEVFFSNQWKMMLGYEPEEIQDSFDEWDIRVHPDDKEKANEDIKKHIEGKTKIYINEHRLRCKDGSYKWILARGVVVQKDEGEKPLRMIGTHTDITDRKKAQQQIEEQKIEFETIFRNSKDGIAIFDLESNFLNFNEAYLEMVGFTEEELIKKSCLELVIEEEKEEIRGIFEKVKIEGNISNIEKSYIKKDKRKIVVNMSMTMLPDKKRILITTKDVTKLKVIESQAKLASMGEMIGSIAHQWRQPLNIITTSISGLMIKSDFDEEITRKDIKEANDTINNQAKYLSKTIDDFKNFIKDNDTEKKDLKISTALEKTLSILSPAFANNNITLVKDIRSDYILKGFENELIQAFINIFNNSKDALKQNVEKEDDRFIFIKTKEEDDRFIVDIKDSGGGIETDIINKVFEPYFTTKHQSIGTGIGLSMTYKIIKEHHNGIIDVSNDRYKYNDKEYIGASFKIIFNKN